MYGFIYQTTNLINGKTYIGMCTHENPIKTEGKIYLGSGKIIKNAIKKYGRDKFSRKILEVCDSEEELVSREAFWIKSLTPQYNIEVGGYGGISDRMKEYWQAMTPEERKKARNWKPRDMTGPNNPMYGRSTSEIVKKYWDSKDEKYRKEFGKKISKTKKELGLGKGKTNPMYGRSAIREQNLKWYTNGKENKYITEGKQPDGYWRGRTNLSGKIGRKKS